MTDKISDVTATASLLLAIVTALMSFWYGELSAALRKAEPMLPAEREIVRNTVTNVLWSKAFPLLMASVSVTSIFFARAFGIVVEAFRVWGTGATYSDMKAALVATELLLLLLAGASLVLIWRLGAKLRRLR